MKSNKTALVTGASRGIGKAVALRLVSLGYDVFAVARNETSLRNLEQEASEISPFSPGQKSPERPLSDPDHSPAVRGNILVRRGDVGDETFIRTLFDEVERYGNLEVLINNAGISYIGLLQDMRLSEWNRLFQTNTTAMFLTCREAIPIFLRRGSGAIVNVSSVWGTVGASCEAAYSATKGAVNSFTRALAKELAPSKIRVNAAAFGVIDTDMNAILPPSDKADLTEEIRMGRFGTPEEAADLIVDLACNHPYMTGQIVTLDGGWT